MPSVGNRGHGALTGFKGTGKNHDSIRKEGRDRKDLVTSEQLAEKDTIMPDFRTPNATGCLNERDEVGNDD